MCRARGRQKEFVSNAVSGSGSLSWDVKSLWPEEVLCKCLTLGHIHQLDHGRSRLLEAEPNGFSVGGHSAQA